MSRDCLPGATISILTSGSNLGINLISTLGSSLGSSLGLILNSEGADAFANSDLELLCLRRWHAPFRRVRIANSIVAAMVSPVEVRSCYCRAPRNSRFEIRGERARPHGSKHAKHPGSLKRS